MTSPAFENNRSLGTDVAGIASIRRATAATEGYLGWLAAHHDSGQSDLGIGAPSVYNSSSRRSTSCRECAGLLAADCVLVMSSLDQTETGCCDSVTGVLDADAVAATDAVVLISMAFTVAATARSRRCALSNGAILNRGSSRR